MTEKFELDDFKKNYAFSFEEVIDNLPNETLDGNYADETEEEIYYTCFEHFLCCVVDELKEQIKSDNKKYVKIFVDQQNLINRNIEYLRQIEDPEQRNIEIKKLLTYL
jgi:hypothetical protein